MQGQPIPFIELKENQTSEGLETTFEIHPQAIKMLQSIADRKVAVLTIAGPQRTGKSFLANRVLKRQKGFAVGPTTMPCTKGIWLWSQPIPLNENTSILLMDTEGLNSVQRDLGVDTKIFSISLLLSSMFVFNQLGHIDEQSIENLSLVIKLSENVSVGSEDKSLSQFFPTFLWVLRDFSLDLKGRSPSEYLEFALQDQSNPGPDGERKNLIRRKIREYFKFRDCICMVRPIQDERRLARVEEEDWNALRPEFISAVQDFERRVSKNIPPKQINGTTLTAEMFLKLSLEYVDAINSGGIPQILTSLDRVIQQEARNLLEELKSQYSKKYQDALQKMKPPFEDEELIQLQKQIEAEIFQRLEQKSKEIIDNSKINSMKKELHEMMSQDLQTRLEINKEQSTTVANQILQKFFNTFQIPVLENVDSIKPSLLVDQFQVYSRFFKYYMETVKGHQKYKHFSEKVPSFLFSHFEKLILSVQKVYIEENNQTKKYLVQAREGEERLRKTIANQESLLYEIQKERDQLKYEVENWTRESNKQEKIKSLELEACQAKVGQLTQELQNKKEKSQKLKQDYQNLQEQLQRVRNELNGKRVECQQLLKRMSDDSQSFRESGEDISNDLVLQYKDMKQQAHQMNDFFKRRAMDHSQQSIFLQEINKLQQDKFNEIIKLREDYKQKKQKMKEDLEQEKIRKSLKNNLEHFIKQNEELKAKNMTYYEKYEQAQKNQQHLKQMSAENQRLSQRLEEKSENLDMHIQVIENFTKDIEKLTSIREDLEQKLAFMNSEKSQLVSFKESFPYILKEALKWVLKQNSKIKHAMKSVGEEEQKIIRDCFHEVGINV
ncbi:unnamed protein product (macronuclear) [Paramecium tetraurelia]|uniref:Chromosome undetermined scaffold_1, whole genome shotgun sequence n=1 Tax=Paramecium tetraurelia TaxID=5888 RepID=Q6BGA8_PARTE|nr:Guanylate-binding protein [Paramecium tetraurelia strain d4-2]XP_001423389.1 uncharacterized protein GSPATT00000426001 [Paramecium tetraurelia]CAH03312.1 Guanylate-binding protein, putative [Paramecium tetraurelia]CAK55991.1 unnamed protein product [Paramecium tetraurelia]|eukprot:XP_001423389.1 hypothetical protein (macronuclear) [Paramecium tetraurelia strain d4-2]